jgi:hypothetical protein
MPPKKGGTKASGGLTLARGIGTAVLKRTLVRWSASGRRHQSQVIDVSQVVLLGDTGEETDGGPLRSDTYEELCALETLLTRESDA